MKPRRRIDVSLQPVGEIVEHSFEGDLSLVAGHEGDFIGDLVPGAMVFFGRCFWWCGASFAGFVGGVEIDHLEMVVEGFENRLAGHACREGRDGCEDCFAHCVCFVLVRGELLLSVGFGFLD